MQDRFVPTKDSMDVMRAAEEKGKQKVGASGELRGGVLFFSTYFDLPMASPQQSSLYYWKLKTY